MSERRTRVAADAALLGLIAAAIAVIAMPAADPARPLVVLLAMCLVPGGALLTRLLVSDVATAFGLAVGLSLAIEALVASVMAVTGWWHPEVAAVALGAVAAAMLALDLRRTEVAR